MDESTTISGTLAVAKGDTSQILNTTQHEKLPLGIDLAWKLTEVSKCDEDVTGSFFHVDVCSSSSVSAVSAKHFIMDITVGSDFRDTPVKWLNVSMKPILHGSASNWESGIVFVNSPTQMKQL
ncbi:hypothetical protein LTR17_026789 [Elasticomyces elasticus]|nr:hypothetical protein LTR17_026789 [Elasticomyces elasticus]